MQKRFKQFGEWLEENVWFGLWETPYQAASYIIWLIITLIVLLTFGVLELIGVCSSAAAIIAMVLVIVGGFILSIVQELIRHINGKKTNSRDRFKTENVFASIMGAAVGCLIICLLVFLLI